MQAVTSTEQKQKKTRKRGTGHVRRFSNGSWQAGFAYQGSRVYIEATSRDEAESKLKLGLAFAASGRFDGTTDCLNEHLVQQGYPSGVKREIPAAITSYNINRNSASSWRVSLNAGGQNYRIGAVSEEEALAKYEAFSAAALLGEFGHSLESLDTILKAAGFPAGRRHSVLKQRKSDCKHEPFENGIRLRCEGYYEGRYYYDKKSWSFYCPTKKETEVRLRAIRASIDDGSYIGKNNETLCGYLVWWRKFAGKTTLRPSTESKYQVYIVNHFIPYFGNQRLQDISTEALQNFFDEKRVSGRADGKEGGLAHKTLNDMKNMLTKALKYAVNPKKIISHNPATEIVMKARKSKEVPIMTTEQMTLLIDEAMSSNSPIGWAIVILLRTGMRKGELLGLQISRIMNSGRYIQIDQALSRIRHPNKVQATEYQRVDIWAKKSNKTGLYLGPPKTESSNRGFPVGRQVTECIQRPIEYQEQSLGCSIYDCPNRGGDNFLLATPLLRPYDPKTFEEHFKKFLEKSGILGISVHSTRHSFTTDILRKFPEELPTISEIVGHADKTTTLRYTHGAENKKTSLMDSF